MPTITALGPTTTSADMVEYIISFQIMPSSLTATDFTLTTSGLTGTAISSIERIDPGDPYYVGGQVSYLISVDTGIGDGTLQLGYIGTGFVPTTPPPPPILAQERIYSGTTADVNQDGYADLIVSYPDAFPDATSGVISVLFGNGDGTFQPGTNLVTGLNPLSVTAADVNGDGKLDLINVNSRDSSVSVFLGNGDGTFQDRLTFSTDTVPYNVVTGDVNGDGRVDLIVSNSRNDDPSWIVPGSISVLLGNGDGTFLDQQSFEVGPYPTVAIGDVNGDGRLDLISADLYVPGDVSVRLGNGDGTFQDEQIHFFDPDGIPIDPYDVKTLDVNGDGYADVITADYGSDMVSVLLSNGDGTFQEMQTYPTGRIPTTLAIADMNADGIADLVAGTVNSVSVLFGNGDGTFQPALIFDTAESASLISYFATFASPVDLNNDGQIDIISSSGLLMGAGAGTFQNQQLKAKLHSYPTTSDVNHDGNPDLIALSDDTNAPSSVSVFLGNGDGTFQDARTYALSSPGLPDTVLAADVSGDGNVDLVISDLFGSSVSVLLGHGDGTFEPRKNYAAGLHVDEVTSADVNNDGKVDLIATDDFYSRVSILLGNGDGTFQSPASIVGITGVINGAFGVTVTDVNGDGNADLIGASTDFYPTYESKLAVLLGNGDGTFQAPQSYAIDTGAYTVATADLNHDGKPDLIVPNSADGTVSVMLGNGDGTFQPQQTFSSGGYSTGITMVDIDDDGNTDLITANGGENTVSVLFGNGNGTFQAPQNYFAGYHPWGVTTADVNHDGKLDILVTTGNQSVAVLLNQSGTTFGPSFTIDAAPVIDSETVNQTIAETNAPLTRQGTVAFHDPDAADTATATRGGVVVTPSTGLTLSAAQQQAFADSFTIAANGAWTFDLVSPDYLAAGQSVKVEATVTVTDSHGLTASQVETFVVNGTNDAPVVTGAVNLGSGEIAGPMIITEAQLLANASDPDNGAVLHVSNLAVAPGTGVLTPIAEGKWAFLPLTGGPTTLSYGVTDGTSTTSDTATLAVAGIAVIDNAARNALEGTKASEHIFIHGRNFEVNGHGGADIFTIADDAVAGALKEVKGGAAVDTFDLSRLTGDFIVDLAAGVAQDVPGQTARLGKVGLKSIEDIVTSSGNDTLSGSKQDNQLTGGHGDDTFVFRTGFGHDTITDFQVGTSAHHDTLDLRGLGFSSVEDVLNHIDLGANAILHAGISDITLIGVNKEQLQSHAFDFLL